MKRIIFIISIFLLSTNAYSACDKEDYIKHVSNKSGLNVKLNIISGGHNCNKIKLAYKIIKSELN